MKSALIAVLSLSVVSLFGCAQVQSWLGAAGQTPAVKSFCTYAPVILGAVNGAIEKAAPGTDKDKLVQGRDAFVAAQGLLCPPAPAP